MTLEEFGRWAGGHRWLERRLFEVLGSWVVPTIDPEAKLMLDRHSRHHAWRAAQWLDRLPVLADVDREALTAPPSPQAEEMMARLGALEGLAPRLAGVYRVALPRLSSRYECHRLAADPVPDGSALRTLRLVSADSEADWKEGERLLQARLVDAGSIQAASDAVSALELVLAPTGGSL